MWPVARRHLAVKLMTKKKPADRGAVAIEQETHRPHREMLRPEPDNERTAKLPNGAVQAGSLQRFERSLRRSVQEPFEGKPLHFDGIT